MHTVRLSSLAFVLCFSLSLSIGASGDDRVNGELIHHSLGHSLRTPIHDEGAFVVRRLAGDSVCFDAAPAEAARISRRPNEELQTFGEQQDGIGVNGKSGLDILWRGTAQLDANPDVKVALERAASIWESRIADPITVFIDVDFGTTRFGEPFEADVVAVTSSDPRGGVENLYAPLRAAVASRSRHAGSALPDGTTLPTDLGPTSRVSSSSVLLRALGAIEATAEPAGTAPSIAFNSAFPYDLDPSDGIAAGETDFEALVVHAIGHMLGFVSRAGAMETGGTNANAPTIFDFFRFPSGVDAGNFASAERAQSSLGEQVFFAGSSALPMTTGGTSGPGGYERQASHWLDDAFTGTRLGVMDPTLPAGIRGELTETDLLAFAMMGYAIVAPNACTESEPNETTGTADPLALPGSCSGTASQADAHFLSIVYSGGNDGVEDIFRVVLGSTAKIKVTLTFTSGNFDMFLFGSVLGGSPLSFANSTSATTESFTTATLSPGTYHLGVSARTGSGSYVVTTELVGGAIPAAPSNLVATGTSTSVIHLTWNDNANNETGFVVQRKISGVFSDLSPVLAANTTSVNVVALPAGTSQTFRVRARGASGDSAYSNEATGATLGLPPGACTPSATVACLLNNRFRVRIDYVNPFSTPPNQPGTFLTARLNATPAINPDVALFGFASAQDIEVVVRLVDARPYANRFDVYIGGLTDVQYTVDIADTQTGRTFTYVNVVGQVGGKVDRVTFPAE